MSRKKRVPSRRIVIVGSSGYIASQLSTHLEQLGHSVLRVPRRIDEADQSGMTSASLLGSEPSSLKIWKDADFVLNLANNFHRSTGNEKTFTDNVELPLELAKRSIETQTHLIHFGSHFEHGPESSALGTYSWEKRTASSELALACQDDKHLLSRVHVPDIYGPGDSRDKLIPSLIRDIKQSNPATRMLTSPLQTFAPLHVADFNSAVEVLLDGISGDFSIMPEDNHSLDDLIACLESIVGRRPKVGWLSGIQKTKTPSECPYARIPDWGQNLTLEEGIRTLL